MFSGHFEHGEKYPNLLGWTTVVLLTLPLNRFGSEGFEAYPHYKFCTAFSKLGELSAPHFPAWLHCMATRLTTSVTISAAIYEYSVPKPERKYC